MKTLPNPLQEKQSIEVAVGTFIISTLLFVLYILSKENAIVLVIAWPFALAAIIVNSIMVFHLTDQFIHLPKFRKDIAVKILIVLSNIPVTFFYYSIIMKA